MKKSEITNRRLIHITNEQSQSITYDEQVMIDSLKLLKKQKPETSTFIHDTYLTGLVTILFVLFISISGCNKLREEFLFPPPSQHVNYKQVNLVSDTTGFNAMRIDSNLINA